MLSAAEDRKFITDELRKMGVDVDLLLSVGPTDEQLAKMRDALHRILSQE